jgi:hypothetical protein
MHRPNRETAVFSTSAVDLFASALGAFILLVMLLFPYYRNAGDESAHSEILDILEQRDLAAGELSDLLASQKQANNELELLNEVNRGIQARLSRKKTELADLKTQVADVPVPIAAPLDIEVPEPEPVALIASEEFSILGLATNAKSFVIVIDMSGSMMAYSDLMVNSVLEILKPLNESNEIAILGYQGAPSPVISTYPQKYSLLQATPENLFQAAEFAKGLSNRFSGSTPTHAALREAMAYPADAIILMSDGQPDNNPNYIVQDVSNDNRQGGKEIHTVAIGDYTENRELVIFLQTLAEQNHGFFVGVSR